MKEATAEKVHEAFDLLHVDNFFALSRAYTREDQKLMKKGKWDASRPSLLTNKVKSILEKIDPHDLSNDDRQWHAEIMWFWYHHAISFAIWKAKDRIAAKEYAQKALDWQGDNHPNRLTKLLWFLVHDELGKAKKWMKVRPDHADKVEHKNGLELIAQYEAGKFFVDA